MTFSTEHRADLLTEALVRAVHFTFTVSLSQLFKQKTLVAFSDYNLNTFAEISQRVL